MKPPPRRRVEQLADALDLAPSEREVLIDLAIRERARPETRSKIEELDAALRAARDRGQRHRDQVGLRAQPRDRAVRQFAAQFDEAHLVLKQRTSAQSQVDVVAQSIKLQRNDDAAFGEKPEKIRIADQ